MIQANTKFTVQDLSSKLNAKLSLSAESADDLFATEISSSASKKLSPPWVYVAIKGTKIDGHTFVTEAFENGAAFAIVEDENSLNGEFPGIIVDDSRVALSKAASLFYGDPSKDLLTIGITGTNGKTTINWLTFHLLNKLGISLSRIGTLGHVVGDDSGDLGLTTPDPINIQKLLKLTKDNGLKGSVLEVSSHSLSQHRVSDLSFDIALYTNLTRDHLDYHDTFNDYKEAKWKLFELLLKSEKKERAAIINIDCEHGRDFANRLKGKSINVITYGRSPDATICTLDLSQDFSKSTITFRINNQEYKVVSPFIGEHNAHNIASVIAVTLFLKIDLKETIKEIALLPSVPGRLQSVPLSDSFGVFVDYAHTPDALENVLKTLRPLVKGKLITIFGCGGDRDKGKRPLMRQVATMLSDKVFVTSDNPRTEDPQSIIADILNGSTIDETKLLTSHPDRRETIAMALKYISPGDILLIAGKGHEEYQIIGSTKYPFSDAVEAMQVWKENMFKEEVPS